MWQVYLYLAHEQRPIARPQETDQHPEPTNRRRPWTAARRARDPMPGRRAGQDR